MQYYRHVIRSLFIMPKDQLKSNYLTNLSKDFRKIQLVTETFNGDGNGERGIEMGTENGKGGWDKNLTLCRYKFNPS